jgi:hypothetical protein
MHSSSRVDRPKSCQSALFVIAVALSHACGGYYVTDCEGCHGFPEGWTTRVRPSVVSQAKSHVTAAASREYRTGESHDVKGRYNGFATRDFATARVEGQVTCLNATTVVGSSPSGTSASSRRTNWIPYESARTAATKSVMGPRFARLAVSARATVHEPDIEAERIHSAVVNYPALTLPSVRV